MSSSAESAGRIERAGNAQNGVEIGSSGKGEFRRGATKGGNVSADHCSIQRECIVAAALETEGNLDVPSRHLFLEYAAELHFERVSTGWQPEVQIEETMVHRLQGKYEGELPIGAAGGGGRFVMLYLTANLRETCHRSYGHSGPDSLIPATALGASAAGEL